MYCEQQFTVFNGQPPLLEAGEDSNYRPKGKVAQVDIDDDTKYDIPDTDDDSYQYLVIINHNYFEAYPLHPFSLWKA
jgi:hypothetical protein